MTAVGNGALLVAITIATASCAQPAPRASVGKPGVGTADPSANPSDAVLRASTPFRGTCDFARPPRDPAAYDKRVQVRTNRFGHARVWATAAIQADRSDAVLGELDSGSVVRANGPVVSGAGAVRGYAVLVRDPSGRACRAYVRADAVDELPLAR